VDGQFGSTGKGLLASLIANAEQGSITKITTNAGPNSGHTGNFPGTDKLFMTRQVPCASVILGKPTWLNAGAIIDPSILNNEVQEYKIPRLYVHPNAAVIDYDAKQQDQEILSRIAGTGKGVGPAIANKVLRRPIPKLSMSERQIFYGVPGWNWNEDVVFVETAQGFSLGINSHFYPHTTSRECTVMQAIADALIPAQMVRGVAMSLRTFPIRVGNTDNSSGGCYPDQEETTWEAIGVEPELTSVTRRVRRVFTWSRIQFREAVAANRPDILFINFMNYLPTNEKTVDGFLYTMMGDYITAMGTSRYDRRPVVLLGYGPYITDIFVWEGSR
jgi:adenylosuccinate synthase